MIGGYAEHGFADKALDLSHEWNSVIQPDSFTLTNVLTACSHAGLVEEAFKVLQLMKEHFSIEPDLFHHNCLLDVLGRANCLQEAKHYFDTFIKEPDIISVMTLLGAARTWKNVKLAEEMAQRAKQLDPKDASSQVLLGNTYALVGRFDDRDKVRQQMKSEKVFKTPGISTVEIDGKPHNFKVNERDHEHITEVLEAYQDLFEKMKAFGYKTDKSYMLHNMKEEQIEEHYFSFLLPPLRPPSFLFFIIFLPLLSPPSSFFLHPSLSSSSSHIKVRKSKKS
jgi:pentatricopeptide repeat protein